MVWLQVIGILLCAVLIPGLAVRMLMPALESSPKAQAHNYAGRIVCYGLGSVWLIWGISAQFFEVLFAQVSSRIHGVPVSIIIPLVFVSCLLGLFDDAYGTSESRGFRGHISALTKGKLTTGGLKLFGISLASFLGALVLYYSSPWGVGAQHLDGSSWYQIVISLVAGAAIALTSNFLNLTDLRPGRASKVYFALLACGALASVVRMGSQGFTFSGSLSIGMDIVWLAGPIVAVVGLDLRERGMLGDAGANPMGVVAGVYIILGLSQVGLILYVLLMFALNVASERISFSKVIAANPVLSRLDDIGRLKLDD